jgi:hypothetical protein
MPTAGGAAQLACLLGRSSVIRQMEVDHDHHHLDPYGPQIHNAVGHISRVGGIVSCRTSAAFLSSTRRLHLHAAFWSSTLHAPWTASVIPIIKFIRCIIPLSTNPNQDETTMEPHLCHDMAGSLASPTYHTGSFSWAHRHSPTRIHPPNLGLAWEQELDPAVF